MLRASCEELIALYQSRWNSAEPDMSTDPEYSWPVHYIKYRCLRKQLKKTSSSLAGREDLRLIDLQQNKQITKLADMWLDIDTTQMRQHIKDSYTNSTVEFIKRVKNRWPGMDDESVRQATRNIWIMNLIQILTGRPVEITDAMFAYSMLYPLTDNVIDDVNLSTEDKKLFVSHLGERLEGKLSAPANELENDVFDMISLIEGQYSRRQFPDVYESLFWIHKAQLDSLSQQYSALAREVITKLSFQKGAASVVADGFLVNGTLNDKQLDFLVGYGITLQLSDDLQDLETDSKCGHQTIFSTAQSKEDMALLTQRLRRLSSEMIGRMPCDHLEASIRLQLGQLLVNSISFLIQDAINIHQTLYPKAYIKAVNRQNPYGLKNYAKLKNYANSCIQKLKPVFEKEAKMNGIIP